jgi:hypothetical protein
MGDKPQILPLRLIVGKGPLRTVGNLLLMWLLGVIAALVMLLPLYPRTGIQWLWLIVLGPPALFLLWVGIDWVSLIEGKYPKLRVWGNILVVLVVLALVAWGVRSVF